MTIEQRERLDAVKARLETLQNAGARAQGAIVRAEEAGADDEAERLIAEAEKELASILKRKRTGKAAK
jgi:hypothetical protein